MNKISRARWRNRWVASGVQDGVKSLSHSTFPLLTTKTLLSFGTSSQKHDEKVVHWHYFIFCMKHRVSVIFKKYDTLQKARSCKTCTCLLFDVGPQMLASANSNCFHDRLLFRFDRQKKRDHFYWLLILGVSQFIIIIMKWSYFLCKLKYFLSKSTSFSHRFFFFFFNFF